MGKIKFSAFPFHGGPVDATDSAIVISQNPASNFRKQFKPLFQLGVEHPVRWHFALRRHQIFQSTVEGDNKILINVERFCFIGTDHRQKGVMLFQPGARN